MAKTKLRSAAALNPAHDERVPLVLPPGVQASYDRKMQSCEAGWRETGDPWAVAEAHTLTVLHRQSPPAWLDDAVWILAVNRRTATHAKGAHEAAIRFMRYEAVRDAHDLDGLSWDRACAHAVKVLAGTAAAAKFGRMWKSYKKVKRHLREGHGGRYFTPKQQQRRSGARHDPLH
jgi:hypothetical protein